MKQGQGSFNTVIAAVIGGVVGAVVAFACGTFWAPTSFNKLKVGELIVSEKMTLWEDGKEDASLLIQNGGILATTRVIATQVCGNAVLANCVLTTPDNPISPLDQCEIFTEMGSSKTEGGLLTVRSPDGGNVIANQGVNSGWAYTVTYDATANPVCLLQRNDNGQRVLGQFIAIPPGQNGTIAVMAMPVPAAQQGAQSPEMSQTVPPGAPMNPNPIQGGPMPEPPANPTPGIVSPGVEQSAMNPVSRQ